MKTTYVVYQIIQGHPALIASDLSYMEAETILNSNDEFFRCTLCEWQDLKDYVA